MVVRTRAIMVQIIAAIHQMISLSQEETSNLLRNCFVKTFHRQEILSHPGTMPNDIFFINKGIVRVIVHDNEGAEHTIHFALENQFIADYSSFIQQESSLYTLQVLEETEVVVMPRSVVEWGYKNLQQGDRLGRLIAEFYFIYQDNRIKNLYARTPKERYDTITEVFPNIHSRVPQHMIASYLGISPVHLSRLKKSDYHKV
jgi:signal-transduction protein with cAMP-binding, CBS, and nucleotidyltransferase domain